MSPEVTYDNVCVCRVSHYNTVISSTDTVQGFLTAVQSYIDTIFIFIHFEHCSVIITNQQLILNISNIISSNSFPPSDQTENLAVSVAGSRERKCLKGRTSVTLVALQHTVWQQLASLVISASRLTWREGDNSVGNKHGQEKVIWNRHIVTGSRGQNV